MNPIDEVSPSKETQTYDVTGESFLNMPREDHSSKVSLDAGSAKPEDSIIVISQAEKTDKIINYSSTSHIDIEINQSMTLSVKQGATTLDRQFGDQRSLIRLVSGDEKFNMTHSAAGSQENSILLLTEASLFKKNPFAQFTISKIKELLSSNHRQ